MRCQDAVVELAQRRDKLFVVGLGLNREYVDCCTQQFAGTQGIGQGVDIHHGTAGSVHQNAARLHLGKLLGLEHVFGRRSFRYVQGNHIGHVQQFLQCAHLRGVTDRQLGNHVVEIDVHSQAFGQHAELGADVAVTDDAKLLATNLVAVLGGFQPLATVGFGVFFRHAAQQQDGLGQNQFCHGTGVGERRVEHGHATAGRGLQVNLVGADTEAAHSHQLPGGFKYFLGQLGARADTNEVRIGNLLDQLFLTQ